MFTYSNAGADTSVELEEFRQYAGKGPAVAIVTHQNRTRVIAVGQTPDGRSIMWLEPRTDTTRHFVTALEKVFGAALASHTARELNLIPRPGQPLESSVVLRAVDMAQNAQAALDGVDFLRKLRDTSAR